MNELTDYILEPGSQLYRYDIVQPPKEWSTDYTNTEINYIIDKRLNDKKSTIITTNLTPKQIEDYYLSSTASRLLNAYDNKYLLGEDLRRLKNANIK